MHIVQKRILALVKKKDISELGYRKLGSLVKEDHPQKVKWHLEKLLRDGKLITDADGSIKLPTQRTLGGHTITVPILGRANCGEPLSVAEEEFEDSIQLSRSLLPKGREEQCFAIRAVGESMNQAQVDGRPINDGDIVLVDGSGIDPREGDYIVASIDGLATLKQYSFDKGRSRIVLLPRSSGRFNPVVINAEDSQGFRVHGRVIDVIPTAV